MDTGSTRMAFSVVGGTTSELQAGIENRYSNGANGTVLQAFVSKGKSFSDAGADVYGGVGLGARLNTDGLMAMEMQTVLRKDRAPIVRAGVSTGGDGVRIIAGLQSPGANGDDVGVYVGATLAGW